MADSLIGSSRTVSRRAPKSSDAAAPLDIGQFVGDLLREGEPDIYRKVALAVDCAVMQAVLRHTKGNQVKASEVLGISRTTLRTKLRALGASIEKRISLGNSA